MPCPDRENGWDRGRPASKEGQAGLVLFGRALAAKITDWLNGLFWGARTPGGESSRHGGDVAHVNPQSSQAQG